MLSQGHFFFIISIFCSFQNKLNYNVEDVCPKYTPVILFHSLVQDMIVSLSGHSPDSFPRNSWIWKENWYELSTDVKMSIWVAWFSLFTHNLFWMEIKKVTTQDTKTASWFMILSGCTVYHTKSQLYLIKVI